MLDLGMMFQENEELNYLGNNEYQVISKKTHYVLYVHFMTEDKEETGETARYVCSSLSSAIASIEALEAGEEI